MQQIVAHGMAPMHGIPLRIIGIVLVEQMILAVIIGKAVGIVHPADPGGEVKRRPGFPWDGRAKGLLIGPGKNQLLVNHGDHLNVYIRADR